METLPNKDFFGVIYGRRGQGKSELARNLVRRVNIPLLIVDPLAEHRAPPMGKLFRPGFNAWDGVCEACDLAFKMGCEKNPDTESDPIPAAFLFVDEMDAAVEHSARGGIPKKILQLAKWGRHQGVCLLLAARRPADIPPSLASQASDIYTFAQTAATDIEYFRRIGIGKEILAKLEKHEFIHRGPEGPPHIHTHPLTGCVEELIR